MDVSQFPELLFLDFDGVLCDSLDEAYRTSWLAYRQFPLSNEALPENWPAPEYRRRFVQCRPYIRSGEDYLLIHQLLAAGLQPQSQVEFDHERQRVGEPWMAGLVQRLYQTRELLLRHHRSTWLSWNPLYPGIQEILAELQHHPGVYILSTKKVDFILEILQHHGLGWPVERAICSGTEGKLAVIDRRWPVSTSCLIDDQIDHLQFDHPRCRCYWALWGYIVPPATTPVFGLSLEDGLNYLRAFNRAPAPDWLRATIRLV